MKIKIIKAPRKQKAYGGPMYRHGGNWTNGIVFINEGGLHSENPFEGVLMGFDQEGVPNLVEEGEIIYNDYVFSNRLKPSKKQLESSGLNKKYKDWTFAKIVEDLQKASAETPLDKISKDSLNDMMNTMMTLQEEVRAKKGLTGENRLMAGGGHIFSGKKDISVPLPKVDSTKITNAANKTIGVLPDTPTKAFLRMNDAPLTDLNAMKELMTRNPKAYQKKVRDYYSSNNDGNSNEGFPYTALGMLAPTIDSLGKTIYNAAKPIDESNIIAEDAYRELPIMQLPSLSHNKIAYRPTDRNAMITPIINEGRATANAIQNLGTSGADVMNRLALNAYNTQNAVGKAYLAADQQDLTNRMQNAQYNLGIDSADAELLQSAQAANIQRAEKIAAAKVADAAQREQFEQLKGQAIDTTSAATMQGIADLTRQNMEMNAIKNNEALAPYYAAIYGKKANGGMLTRNKRRK